MYSYVSSCDYFGKVIFILRASSRVNIYRGDKMDNCSFYSDENNCHQFRHTRKKCIRNLTKYEEIKLLRLRTGGKRKDIKTICSHHEQELLTKFSILNKKCCDPYNKHSGKSRTKALRVISLDIYEKICDPPSVVVPGVKVCCDCWMNLQNQKVQQIHDETDEIKVCAMDMDVDNNCTHENADSSFVDLNSTLVSLDETPVKTGKLPVSTKITKGKKKLASATQTLKRKLESMYEVPLDSSNSEDEQYTMDLKLYQTVMTELKEKFAKSQNYQERVQILTVSPFTIDRTMKEFGATNYLVKKSRYVKKQKGILGQCCKNKGKALSEELTNDIISFYESDENSRMCPGMKDSVSIRNKDGEKVQHQKRLILSNLKELHSSWKESYPDKKVGFSSFASLRPKWCVLAGSSGTHSVCVCKYHQNPKLMAEACLKSTVKDLMKFCVCSTEDEKCMMGHCKECPGREGLVDHLNNCDELTDVEDITYQQWISTDRTKLTAITESKNEFIETFSSQLLKLTRHSFTAKSQSTYMKDLKSSMNPLEEIILQGDFAENYSYVVQDEIQSFHWENKQATLHPFVAYRKLEDGTLEHRNICVVSDVKEHSTSTVYAFQHEVLDYLKTEFPEIKKVHYFTDGCAKQYKNKHNFINLCCHYKDFGLEAEWNFFATSHGKSACDGIGGTVKRLLTKASLQRPYSDPILTIEAIMEFCVENIPGIKFFNVPPEDVNKFDNNLRNRFEISRMIKGTLQFHRFVPLSQTHLSVYKLSAQVELPVVVAITAQAEDDISELPLNITEQNYVCCLYDNEPWIGLVENISDEHGDYCINFMHPHGPAKLFCWPRDEDRCWVDKKNIVCVINTPSFKISTRMYSISQHDIDKIATLCQHWK